MKTMAWTFQDGFVLVVHADKPPSDEEWRLYVEECAARVGGLRGGVALTDGHGPNAAQRGLVVDEEGLIDVPFAIVTGSVVVRGIVTALRWLGKNIKAFSPAEIGDAFVYLALDESQKSKFHDELAQLRMSLLEDQDVASLNAFRPDQRDEYVLSTSLALIRREMDDIRKRMSRIS